MEHSAFDYDVDYDVVHLPKNKTWRGIFATELFQRDKTPFTFLDRALGAALLFARHLPEYICKSLYVLLQISMVLHFHTFPKEPYIRSFVSL